MAQQTCDVYYNPFLKCGNQACFRHNNHDICLYHLYLFKKNDDCCICLEDMTGDKELIVLSCGHMFHLECLSNTLNPSCPLCRTQMNKKEASIVFHSSIIEPFRNELFSLPLGSLKYVLLMIDMIIYIGKRGEYIASEMCRKMTRLFRQM